MAKGEYPRFKNCTLCGNAYPREKECWYCPKPEQQKVRGKPGMIGSEPWGSTKMVKLRAAEREKAAIAD
jgi:hypothetical protein